MPVSATIIVFAAGSLPDGRGGVSVTAVSNRSRCALHRRAARLPDPGNLITVSASTDRIDLRAPAGGADRGTLASRLETVDRLRFVGRAVELAALESCLADGSAMSVIHVYGPGGIGKSTLLREFARRAEARGWERFVVEGRELTPSPETLDTLLSAAAGSPRPLVLIDTYERMNGLGGHLRRALLPRLPDTAVVVIAGRNPPEESWFQGGREAVAGEFELGKLGAPEALALLSAHGVTDERRTAIVQWADGSPLALALAADAAGADRDWHPAADAEDPEMLRSLIRRLAEAELGSVRFSLLAVAAIARVTTAEMLGAVLAEGDADGAYERLRGLSFSEPVGDGLALHELVRKALRADLRRRDRTATASCDGASSITCTNEPAGAIR